MAAPTTLTITYTGGSGSPQTVAIPKPDGTNPQEFTQAVRNIYLNNGFWVVLAGVNTFIPASAITSITAQ